METHHFWKTCIYWKKKSFALGGFIFQENAMKTLFCITTWLIALLCNTLGKVDMQSCLSSLDLLYNERSCSNSKSVCYLGIFI